MRATRSIWSRSRVIWPAGPHIEPDCGADADPRRKAGCRHRWQGPFCPYDNDPIDSVHFCVAHRINYLTRADDARFTAGIVALNGDAMKSNVFALSWRFERAGRSLPQR